MLGSMVPLRRRFPATFSRVDKDVERFWDPLDRFFNQEDWEMIPTPVFPRANILETEAAFEVTLELPGMNAEDVKVEFQNGWLLISGEKKEVKEEKGRVFHRIEREFGKFNRRFELPGFINEPEIVAEFLNGVLRVIVPKSPELKPKQIKVKKH